mgnify:CR=1 FL=1
MRPGPRQQIQQLLPEELVCAGVVRNDPDQRGSFGTYAVLWQIEQARSLKLPYLYLGYWIAESPKMAYKVQFRPYEILVEGRWRPSQDTPDAG